MGLLALRFSFEREPPSFHDVERALRPEVGRSLTRVELGPVLGGARTLRIRDGVGAALLERSGTEWTVRADLHRSAPIHVARRLLVALGGVHPPRIDPSVNPLDLGESWYGILAEGGDLELHTVDRVIRVWHGFLSRLEGLADTDLLAVLEAHDLAAFEHALMSLPPDALARDVFGDALPRVHAELLAFLTRARASRLDIGVRLDV